MTTKVTVKMYEVDQTTRELYALYDWFRLEKQLFDGIVPEPIAFARYFINHPEKWKEAQELEARRDETRPQTLS